MILRNFLYSVDATRRSIFQSWGGRQERNSKPCYHGNEDQYICKTKMHIPFSGLFCRQRTLPALTLDTPNQAITTWSNPFVESIEDPRGRFTLYLHISSGCSKPSFSANRSCKNKAKVDISEESLVNCACAWHVLVPASSLHGHVEIGGGLTKCASTSVSYFLNTSMYLDWAGNNTI